MRSGTGQYYKLSGIECFGKTGTTNDNKDRWFAAGTPDYVAVTWYGYDTPKEVHYNLSYNPSGTIWNLVMKEIYETKDNKGVDYKTEFPEFDGIVQRSYCRHCGKLLSGSGNYGWYDVNNLPGYCGGGHVEETSKEDEKNKDKDKDNKNNTDKNKDKNKESTASNTNKETTAAPETTAAKNEE